MARRRPYRREAPGRSYAWARKIRDSDPRVRALANWARWGLGHARQLAEDAEERQLAALAGQPVPKKLTIAALAREEFDVSAAEIQDQIAQARLELFGRDLSDRAIRYRLRRDRELGDPTSRPCQEDGCKRPLPLRATARRRYCDFHLASHARIRRWRERQATL